MSLPYPGMDYIPFDILTAEELDQMVANIESLADGSGFDAGAISTEDIADNAVTVSKLGNQVLAYSERIAGQTFTTTADLTSSSISFTVPDAVTSIWLRAELTISGNTSGMIGLISITDSSNNTIIQRSKDIDSSGTSALGTINLNRRINVTPGANLSYKIRVSNGGSGTVVINNGDSANRPSILWAEL